MIAINCPECGGDSCTLDTRESREKEGIKVGSRRRRRECVDCSTRFTTYELSAETIHQMEVINMLMLQLQKSTKDFASRKELE